MRMRNRLFVVAAAAFLIGGAESLHAATAPAIRSGTVAEDGATNRPVLTLTGKSLTKFTAFTFKDPSGGIVMGATDTLVRSSGTLVLLLPAPPAGAPSGLYLLEASIKTGEVTSFPVPLSDPAAPGTLNDPANPMDWTRLKGVPAAFADGTDDGAWTTSGDDVYRSGGRVGVGVTTPAADLHVLGAAGVLFEGTVSMTGPPASGSGRRMMWYPTKAAFRAGYVNNTQWDDVNIGYFSVATGGATIASGDYSTATGYFATASGMNSFATGDHAIASGTASAAMGGTTTASGSFATAMGSNTTAGGAYSTAMGSKTIAGAVYSLATGYSTSATGDCSTAMGEYVTAQAYESLALGRYNVVAGTTNSWVPTDPILVVGNGSGAGMGASNAFTLLKNGNLTIAGTLTQNSDLRLKKDVTALTGVLARIGGIRGVSYEFKDTARSPEGRQIGLVAQEVRAAFPELVREDTQGNLSVSYQNFSAVLLEAVKEQQASLDARDREVAALKEKLAATDARLSRLEALLRAEAVPESKGK